MRYLLLICSDDRGQAPPPRAEMEAIVREKGASAGHAQAAPEDTGARLAIDAAAFAGESSHERR